jgi:tetratricopeptide (TPR) repeat protein
MPQDQVQEKMNGYISQRKFNEMIGYAEEMIQENPGSYLGTWWKARALTFKGDSDGALLWFMESMKKAESDEEESKISSSMANVYNVRKQWEDSLNFTAIALELNPKNVVAVISRSIALSSSGRRSESSKLLDSNQKLFKDNYQKACVSAVKRDKQRMLEHLRKTVEETPHCKVTVQYDPDFANYRGDPEFKKLTA